MGFGAIRSGVESRRPTADGVGLVRRDDPSPPGPGPFDGIARRLRIATACLALLTLALWRFPDLGARGLWFDEAFSWRLTRFPWAEMIARAGEDVHPPLYYILLKLWTSLFGDSVFAMRALSTFWFVVALVGTSLFCREAGSRSAARDAGPIALLFLCASPFLFRYCQEVRMYTQVAGLVTTGSWLLLRALRARERPGAWWAAYGLVATALAFTHYFGLFTLAAQAFFVCGLLLVKSAEPGYRRWCLRTLGRSLATGLGVTLLYLPWIPTVLCQRARVVDHYWIQPLGPGGANCLRSLRAVALQCVVHDKPDQTAPSSIDAAPALPGTGLLVAVATALALMAWPRDRAGAYLVLGVTVPPLLAVSQSVLMGRDLLFYRYFIAPHVLLLVGCALVVSRVSIGAVRWFLAAQVVCALAAINYSYHKTADIKNQGEYQGASEYIASHLRPGDLILCSRLWDFFPMAYHARGRFPVLQARYPGLVVTHYNGGPILREADLIGWRDALSRRDRRVWLVDNEYEQFRPLLIPEPSAWHCSLPRTLRFPEPIRFRGAVLLTLWEPRGHEQSPSSVRDRPTGRSGSAPVVPVAMAAQGR